MLSIEISLTIENVLLRAHPLSRAQRASLINDCKRIDSTVIIDEINLLSDKELATRCYSLAVDEYQKRKFKKAS